MKAYARVFVNQLRRKLEHKFDFFLKRLQSVIALLILYFVWINAASTKSFAGYTKLELVTYIVGANIVAAFIFAVQSRDISFEINTGYISAILVKPVNYFWYCFSREAAERLIAVILSVLEVCLLGVFLHFSVFVQTNPVYIFFFLVSLILGFVLYHLICFLVSISAFWWHEAYGPRWLFEWLTIFASGQYFPLSILSVWIKAILYVTPLSLTLFFPLMIYLGRLGTGRILTVIAAQILWIAVVALFTRFIWKRGLRIYTAEGI